MAYRLELPDELSRIHDIFHISVLKKYLIDPSHVLEPPPLELREDLSLPVQPVTILDQQVRKLRSKKISLVKILWRSDQVEEETWELEEAMRRQHPQLLAV